MNKTLFSVACVIMLLSINVPCIYAAAPPNRITSIYIASNAAKHYLSYTHLKVIGACIWLKCGATGCYTKTTPELDEYLPDLTVTVFDKQGDDPWEEANLLLDPAVQGIGSSLMNAMTGYALANGNKDNQNTDSTHEHDGSERSYAVDVIGSPMNLIKLPLLTLRYDTTAFMPYYSAATDAISDRSGVAEMIKPETYDIFSYYVGPSMLDNWGYEFPRSMEIAQSNNYKGSILAALHAADIVTNSNTLHIVKSTHDSCGINCAVANVIEENSNNHEIWEEVYPYDHSIQLGQSDLSAKTPLGEADDQAGNGNYVFLIWRHYKGCVQANGKLLYATVNVPPTVKR